MYSALRLKSGFTDDTNTSKETRYWPPEDLAADGSQKRQYYSVTGSTFPVLPKGDMHHLGTQSQVLAEQVLTFHSRLS